MSQQTPAARDRSGESGDHGASSGRSGFLYPGMALPFTVLVACFAAWGVAANMTDPLVRVFGSVFSMSTFQSSLVQFAYYGAYFVLAIPAAFITYRFGYKTGVVLGLLLAAVGGYLFFPASQILTYGMFLAALFTLAAGLSILETSANPFVMSLGPEHNATRRLNFAQAFNPIGANLGVLLAATLIIPNVTEGTPEQRAALGEEALRAVQSEELSAVMAPYVGLATLYVLLALAVWRAKVHERHVEPPADALAPRGNRLGRLVRNGRYSFGVIAQYFNIAAQTCIWTYTLHYTTEVLGISDTAAGVWLQASLLVFLVFRFLMVGLMGRFDSRKLMVLMCTLGVIFSMVAVVSTNIVGAISVVLLSACISLLFPTIYGVALEGMDPDDTKFGAAGLVMAILGGATVPVVQGALIDATSAAFSFVIPAICFAVIIGFGIYALRHQPPLDAHQAVVGA